MLPKNSKFKFKFINGRGSKRKAMNWRYVPFAGFFLFALLGCLLRYIFLQEVSFTYLVLWFAAQYGLLLIFWFTIRTIARFLDKKLPYFKGFSRRVFFQIIISLLILVPLVLLGYAFIKPYLASYVSPQYIALTWILLFVVIVLMNTGLAAGIFFANWQRSVKEKAKAEEEKKNTELELIQMKQKQSEIEMKALRAQMNPHFIFNSLNSINKYILKNDHVNASRYLTRFAKLIRLILDNSNSKEIALSDELEALKLYIEMELLRFTNKFTYGISVDENVSPDTLQVPPLVIQPYVENAIWHGLLHKEADGRLNVSVKKTTDNMLQCSIEDNGIGRSKAMEMKSKSANANRSLGMKLTAERISMLNQYTSLNASIEIVDLVDNNGEASGTKVILKIPI
ncbi:MAG TPA: histidine kinase [Agriterribacter sp.]|nr:histidine kinase [Agriterribacter sp.]HRQ49022.1 histidine kinase [Agriterribacter sp.]